MTRLHGRSRYAHSSRRTSTPERIQRQAGEIGPKTSALIEVILRERTLCRKAGEGSSVNYLPVRTVHRPPGPDASLKRPPRSRTQFRMPAA
jgi:hypothetical protein